MRKGILIDDVQGGRSYGIEGGGCSEGGGGIVSKPFEEVYG